MLLVAATLAPALTLGAVFGSFLSVVASRVPPLVLSSPHGRVRLRSLFSALSLPASHCTHCDTPLRWRDNIPLLSYLALRGRCRTCHTVYGGKYFLLELGGAAAGVISVHSFGWSLQGALCFLLLSLLLVLSTIDLAEMLLPDVLVYPLLPAGLTYQALFGDGLTSGILGALAAFAILWAIGASYRLTRMQEGLGGGDTKLAGAMGAWIGLANVPFFLVGAFSSGLVVMSLFLMLSGRKTNSPVPFGPFLAMSGAVFLLLPQAAESLRYLIIA